MMQATFSTTLTAENSIHESVIRDCLPWMEKCHPWMSSSDDIHGWRRRMTDMDGAKVLFETTYISERVQ